MNQMATPTGFEPVRAEPNGFLVHLLSHSDTVSCLCLIFMRSNNEPFSSTYAGRTLPPKFLILSAAVHTLPATWVGPPLQVPPAYAWSSQSRAASHHCRSPLLVHGSDPPPQCRPLQARSAPPDPPQDPQPIRQSVPWPIGGESSSCLKERPPFQHLFGFTRTTE